MADFKQNWVWVAIGLLATLVLVEGAMIWRLNDRVERQNDPGRPSLTAPTPSPVDVPGISKPDSYVDEAVAEVVDALEEMAREEEAYRKAHGEFLGDPIKLAQQVELSSDVQLLQIFSDATGVCLEAAHSTVKGARRRFLSSTGQIDFGRCDFSHAASEQISQPLPAEGSWQVTTEPIVDLSDPEAEYKVYAIPFEASWEGGGTPSQMVCSYTLFSGNGGVVKTGEYGINTMEDFVKERYRVPVYEWDSKAEATEAEFSCSERY